MTTEGGGAVTGTRDKDYNLVWFVEASLSNALRLATYIRDADESGDEELADFFRRAQAGKPQGGVKGKKLLAQRLSQPDV